MELTLYSSVVQFFMKEGQFQHHIIKMPPKVLKIYCFRWVTPHKRDYRNDSPIDLEALYRTMKESAESRLLDCRTADFATSA
jgi:hypothetical protein